MDARSPSSTLNTGRSERRAYWLMLFGSVLSAFASPVAAGVSNGTFGVSLTIEPAECVLVSVAALARFGLDVDPSATGLIPATCGLECPSIAPELAPASVTSGRLDRNPTTGNSAEAAIDSPLAPAPVEIVTITY